MMARSFEMLRTGFLQPRLSRRIALAMVLALVAVQLQAFTQIRLLSSPELRLTGVRQLSDATHRAVVDALGTREESRTNYFTARTTDPHLKIWWSREPSIDETAADERPLSRQLVATLEAQLGELANEIRVSVAKFSLRLPMNSARIVVVPEGLENQLSTHAVGEAEPEVLLASGAGIAVRLVDGSWVNVQHSSFVDTAFGSTLPMLPLLAGGLMITVVSIFLARRLVSPLDRLVVAANRIGRVREPVAVEKSGLHEFAAVAHAFEDMQQRLLSFVEGRTQILAAISHDLRSALTRLQLIAERTPSESHRAALTAEIRDMAEMLDSTMTFASGEARLAPDQPTDVAALLISLADEAADAGRDCTYEGPDHIETLANPVSLKRAFRNVIDNAIKYGNRARIRLAEHPSYMLIEVLDNGPGIPASSVENAFAPFERLDAARSNVVKGAGLGLTITRDVVKSHGGTIRLDNRDGGGLNVSIRLPISPT